MWLARLYCLDIVVSRSAGPQYAPERMRQAGKCPATLVRDKRMHGATWHHFEKQAYIHLKLRSIFAAPLQYGALLARVVPPKAMRWHSQHFRKTSGKYRLPRAAVSCFHSGSAVAVFCVRVTPIPLRSGTLKCDILHRQPSLLSMSCSSACG